MKLFYLLSLALCVFSIEVKSQQWQIYTTANSNSPYNEYQALSIDDQNHKWFLKHAAFYQTVHLLEDTLWIVHNNQYFEDPYYFSFETKKIDVDKDQSVWQWWHSSVYSMHLFQGNFTKHSWYSTGIMGMDYVHDLAIDTNNVKWFGGEYGLVKCEDTVFSSVIGVPDFPLLNIEVDHFNQLWALSADSLMVNSSGVWSCYPQPFSVTEYEMDMQIDTSGNVWIGHPTLGLYKWDGSSWINYCVANSGIPSDVSNKFTIDMAGNVWLSYNNGISKFDGVSWTNYDAGAGYIGGTGVYGIEVDKFFNVWKLSSTGVVVFNENGIVGLEEVNSQMGELGLFPNPVRDNMTIQFEALETEVADILIITITGQIVNRLPTDIKKGNNAIQININDLSPGTYILTIEGKESLIFRKFIKQ